MRALSQRLTGSQVPGGRAIEAPPTVAAERAWNRNVQSQLLIHQVRACRSSAVVPRVSSRA